MKLWFPVKADEEGQPLIEKLKGGQKEYSYHEKGYIPDWEYMKERIKELEVERIKELDTYLTVTGLKSYTLTQEERTCVLGGGGRVVFSVFNVEKLFGKSTRGKRLKSLDRIKGKLPFVTAGEANEGISDYIGNDVEIFEPNTSTIDMFGSAKYRDYRYGADDHVAVVHTEKLAETAAIFVTACLHKSAHAGKFDYSNNFYAKDADSLDKSLPIQVDASGRPVIDMEKKYNADGYIPDWNYMEKYVRVVQKLAVADVVKYSERIVETSKNVIV